MGAIAVSYTHLDVYKRQDLPILLAGMGGVARSELVAAVAQAGGYGILGMVRETPRLIAQEIAAVRTRTDRPFAVNPVSYTHLDVYKRQPLCCRMDTSLDRSKIAACGPRSVQMARKTAC